MPSGTRSKTGARLSSAWVAVEIAGSQRITLWSGGVECRFLGLFPSGGSSNTFEAIFGGRGQVMLTEAKIPPAWTPRTGGYWPQADPP